jgi:hypothetical protein
MIGLSPRMAELEIAHMGSLIAAINSVKVINNRMRNPLPLAGSGACNDGIGVTFSDDLSCGGGR